VSSAVDRSPWRTFALIAGAVVSASMNYSVTFISFGEIQKTFAAGPAATSWVLNAFAITVIALLIPSGWVSDRFGRRRMFLTGVALLAVGSLLVATAPTLPILIAARVVQAAGLALEGPAALAILLDAFSSERRSTAVGAYGGLGGISLVLGPVVGGLVIDVVGWRWTFAMNIPIAMLTVVLGLMFLSPDRPAVDGRPGRPDLGGAILMVVGTAMLATGIVQAGEWGWTNPLTVVALVMAPTSLAMVVRRSASHPHAILDLSLYRVRYFGRGNLMAFLIAGNFAGTYLALITLLTGAWAMSPSAAGAALALVPLIGGPMSFVSGRLADRYGHRRLLVPGGACMVVGALWFRSGVGPDPDMWLWFPAVALYALGVGLAHANSASLALRFVPGPSLGQAGATNRIMTEIGSVCSVAVTIALLVGADDPVEGVRRVMLLLALAGMGGMVVAAGVDTRPRQMRSAEAE
jgi:MFS family permease